MSIDKRPNGRWRARWREADGKQRARHFDRKVDADRFLTTIKNAQLVGTYVDPAKGKVTLASYAAEWFERMKPTWRDATATLVESNLRNHIKPSSLGVRPIGQIRRTDVEAWAAALTLAPGTVATVRQHLGQVLQGAVEDGLIPRNPCLGARLPRAEEKRAKPIDPKVLEKIAVAAPAWFAVAIPIGLGLGLRQGEACGLTVDRVDFLRRVVRIDRQRITSPGGVNTLEAPKTASSFRTIPLPTFVADALSTHIATHGVGDHGVLLHDQGAMLARNRFGDVWRSIRVGDEHYHDLRHTFASTLLSAGVSVKAVADWLGHANPAITLSTYAHLMPVDEDRARTVLDGAFRAAEDSVRTAAGG
ncbi:MAG: tyrosine-type recombinase/integrase [Ilumatobacteraceae bacterium]